MHRVCIVCAMAYRAAVVGGVRVYGGRAAAAARRPPRDRGRARHGRLQRGRGGRPTSTRRSRPAYGDLRFAPLDAADLSGLDLVFCRAAARREPGAAARAPRRRRRTSIDLGADFRLPPDVYPRWYGEPHAAPELDRSLRVRARRALPRRPRDARARRGARLLPDRGQPRVRAAARARARRAAASSPTRSPASRARAAA